MKYLLKDRRLYVIFSITMISVLGVASISPALPYMSKALKVSHNEIILLISFFTFPGIFVAPLAGVLADRYGRKKVLFPAVLLFSLSGFACFWTKDFRILLILRFLQGIGAGPLGSLNVTLVADFFQGKDRPAAMGYNASVQSIFTASYPVIGGLLAAVAWNYPFILPIIGFFIGIFVVFGIDEPLKVKNDSFLTYFKYAIKSMKKKEVIGLFSISSLTFIILYGAFLTYIPFVLDKRFSFTPSKIGLLVSLSSVTSGIVATQIGNLTKKFSSTTLLKTAFILYTIVSFMIPFIFNKWLMIIPILLFGTAQALNIPSVQTLLASIAPDSQRAVFMSINGMVLRLGQTLGPLIIGLGFSVANIVGAYLLSAIISLIGLLIIFLLLNMFKKNNVGI